MATARATNDVWRGVGLVLALLLLGACDEPGASLTIDLRTDLSPGNEFVSIRTDVSSSPFASAGDPADDALADEAFVVTGADYVSGRRVASFDGVPPGPAFVRVSLIDARGDTVVDRVTTVTVRGRVSMVVAVTRACRGVVCPDPSGSADATSCSAGQCVPPTCTPETPEFCGEPECTTHADCAVAAECATSVCASGECFELGDHTRCASDEWCNPDLGCVLRTGVMRDAGPVCPPTETSCTDELDDDCDGLIDCADPDCGGQSCDDGDACTENDVCGGDGGVCGGTAITCDDANGCTDDACDPATGACAYAPNTASCDDGLFCNGADTCTGGACAAHAGTPCTEFCSETAGACTQCETVADCGTAPATTWGACNYANNCDESATQIGTMTTLACNAGMCETTVTNPTRACTRETDGTRPTGCNGITYGAWPGTCTTGFSNACDTTGTHSRNVDTQSCAAGSCSSTRTSESRGCSRSSREGVSCGTSTRSRCCSGTCVDTWTSEAHCGGCGLDCVDGMTCTIVRQGGGAACRACWADAQCGTSEANATCWITAHGGADYCRCQSNAGCAPGQICRVVTQFAEDRYCYYP